MGFGGGGEEGRAKERRERKQAEEMREEGRGDKDVWSKLKG